MYEFGTPTRLVDAISTFFFSVFLINSLNYSVMYLITPLSVSFYNKITPKETQIRFVMYFKYNSFILILIQVLLIGRVLVYVQDHAAEDSSLDDVSVTFQEPILQNFFVKVILSKYTRVIRNHVQVFFRYLICTGFCWRLPGFTGKPYIYLFILLSLYFRNSSLFYVLYSM